MEQPDLRHSLHYMLWCIVAVSATIFIATTFAAVEFFPQSIFWLFAAFSIMSLKALIIASYRIYNGEEDDEGSYEFHSDDEMYEEYGDDMFVFAPQDIDYLLVIDD